MTDRDLVQNLLAGHAAASELVSRFRKRIEAHLLARCDSNDGNARLRAVEIASEVIADCVRKDPPLVTRWDGQAPLLAFLNVVAENRLKNWWASAAVRKTTALEPETMAAFAGQPAEAASFEDIAPPPKALEEAVRRALHNLVLESPEPLAFFRLRALHGIEQRWLAQIWGVHESTVSRHIKKVTDHLLACALESQRAADPEATRAGTLALLCRHPSLFAMPARAPLSPESVSALERLASGQSLSGRDKNYATTALASDDTACATFVGHLPSVGAVVTPSAADETIARAHATLSAARASRAASLEFGSLQRLIRPPIHALLEAIQCRLHADGAALWLVNPARSCLTVAACPAFPSIVGQHQPLASGLVCFAFSFDQIVAAGDAAAHPAYSPGIDLHLQRTTRHLIAIPVHIANSCRGVISAIRFAPEAPPFSTDDTDAATHLTSILGQQLDAALVEE
jgi:DNA-directed RNA polymerase specialized sigma24 family protein